jgi:transmembrane sensor
MMTREQLQPLIEKYLSGNATEEELALMEKWYYDYDQDLEVIVHDGEESTEEELHDKILSRLRATIGMVPKARVVPLWKKLAAAAAVAALLSAGAWYLIDQRSGDTSSQVAQQTGANAGFEQAILTTSDGSKIELGKNNHLPINEKDGSTISNNGNQLSYTASSTARNVFYNTLEVPRRGMYSVELADGTKVWLNSLSSLKYATSFPGKERRVSIKGEAFFEIAKNPRQPFIVEVDGGQEIEVLGTSFNVNAYTNEQLIRTTLLEGAIRVKAGNANQKLAAGQEAQLNIISREMILNNHINATDAISWKDGFFVCNGKDLQAILRQVARWYDIEVEYKGSIQPESFAGSISRNMDLSELLKVLEITGVQFSLQGRKLTVLP